MAGVGTRDHASAMPRLSLGNMCYFDMIDAGDALADETALAAIEDRNHPGRKDRNHPGRVGRLGQACRFGSSPATRSRSPHTR